MRLKIGRALRVGPGDRVVIRGQLAAAKLGRLFVFAKEGEAEFSPYVTNVREKLAVGGEPRMLSPMALRLDPQRPQGEISFVSDIDGYICVIQEVDTAKDPKVKVTLKRQVCPDLPWLAKVSRHLSGILSWRN
jgi:hypothetical protein